MKYLITLLLVLLALPVTAQNRMQGNMAKRVEELEKVKLIEALNLDETKSIQFFTKRRDFRGKQRDVNSELDSLASRIENLVANSQEKDKIKDAVALYTEKEKQLCGLKNNYVNDIKSILNDEEFAKLIIFERNFKKDVQQMIMKRGKRMRGTNDE